MRSFPGYLQIRTSGRPIPSCQFWFSLGSHSVLELNYSEKKTFSFQGELVLATAYGYEAHERDGVMIDAAKKVNKFGIEHIQPGALLVNHIPFRMCSRFFPALMET